jgi:hypothetical protein
MAHFAELDGDNVVLRVVVVPDEEENDGENWCSNLFGGTWKQTSYNNNIRAIYAGIGYTYDPVADVFIRPKPFPSWVMNNTTHRWEAPVANPYLDSATPFTRWDEDSQTWLNTP